MNPTQTFDENVSAPEGVAAKDGLKHPAVKRHPHLHVGSIVDESKSAFAEASDKPMQRYSRLRHRTQAQKARVVRASPKSLPQVDWNDSWFSRSSTEKDSMRCIIVDHRDDFASILIDKLGIGFALAGTNVKDCAKDCDVIMVAVPPAGDPAFAEQSAALTKAALNTSGVPVVALVPASDRKLGLRALTAGAYDSFVETDTLEELHIILRRAARFRLQPQG